MKMIFAFLVISLFFVGVALSDPPVPGGPAVADPLGAATNPATLDPTNDVNGGTCPQFAGGIGGDPDRQSAPLPSPSQILSSTDCQFVFGCNYYEQCIGRLVNCDTPNEPDYFSNYGGKYCQRFKAAHDNPKISGFGEGSKLWDRCTLICLQRALDKMYHCSDHVGNVPSGETPNQKCMRYYQGAFDSHPDCYTDSGLCFLAPPTQQAYIATIVDPSDLITAESRRQIAQATENCAINYYDSTQAGFNGLTRFQQEVILVQVAATTLQICEVQKKIGLRSDCLVEERDVRNFNSFCRGASRPANGWDCSIDWNEGTNQFFP